MYEGNDEVKINGQFYLTKNYKLNNKFNLNAKILNSCTTI